MTALTIFHVVVLIALTTLALQTILNLRAVRRLSDVPPPLHTSPTVSVLIPARNEATCIEACIAAWRRQEYASYEVLIFDDDSTDETAERARAAAAGASNVQVIRGGPLPDGWRGKTHACHRLRDHARGDVLVFADADVVPAPLTLACAVGALQTGGVHVLSALPSHTSARPVLRALTAIQNWAALTLAPLWLRAVRRTPCFAVMNGQFFMMGAGVYDASGGFGVVSGSLGEDAVLGRRLVALGYEVELVDGTRMLACHGYSRYRDLWQANVRNLAAVLFGSSTMLLVSAAALATVYLGPLVLIVLGAALGHAGRTAWTWLPLLECVLSVGARALVGRRTGHGVLLALLHPLTVGMLVAMQLQAFSCGRGHGEVEWRGRRYRAMDEPA